MVVLYENLLNDIKEQTLKDIYSFLNFKVNDARLECVLGHMDNRFKREKKCLKHKLEENYRKPEKAQSSGQNIFTDHHRIWINSAIRKVKSAIKARGLTTYGVIEYENTSIQLPICT